MHRKWEQKIPLNQTKCLIAINQKLIWDTILLRFALLVGIRLRHFYLKRYGPNSKERTIWVYSHFINRRNNRNIHSFIHSLFQPIFPEPSQHPRYTLGNTTVKKIRISTFLELLLLLLSRFSCVRLCATPQMAAYQASPSLGFSRQEHWSGLPVPSPMYESEKWKWSRSVLSDS